MSTASLTVRALAGKRLKPIRAESGDSWLHSPRAAPSPTRHSLWIGSAHVWVTRHPHTHKRLPCSQQIARLVSFLGELGMDGLGNNSSSSRFGCQVGKNKDIRLQRFKNKEVLFPSFKFLRNRSLGSHVWKPCQLVSPFRLACVIGH